jgi:glyoxylase-like metal-dependent hydrolase (beta-lactamase superfamily II)
LAYIPPWAVNAGFVVGDEITLVIDTGANALAAATIYGYASSIRPHNTLRVLNCEKHFDHIGGNSFFADRGCEIWGHVGISRTAIEFACEISEFNDAIPYRDRRINDEANVFFAGTRLCMPVHYIGSDMEIELGACRIKILLTPGHTDTNLSVWVPSDGVLFSADCLVNGYRPNVDAANFAKWRHSLDRLKPLNPSVVIPGHGAVATKGEVGEVFEHVLRAMH